MATQPTHVMMQVSYEYIIVYHEACHDAGIVYYDSEAGPANGTCLIKPLQARNGVQRLEWRPPKGLRPCSEDAEVMKLRIEGSLTIP